MRYLIMECHLSYAVALDEAGRFVKVANLGYEVGQRVQQVVIMRAAPPQAHSARRFPLMVCAVAACLCLMFFGVYQPYFTAFATVRMQINPDVQMTVSRMDRVLALKGLNADGEALIAAYDYSGKSKEHVSNDLVDRAMAMGYLSEGDSITISVDSPNSGWTQRAEEEVSAALSTHLSSQLTVIISVTPPDRAPLTPAPAVTIGIAQPALPTPSAIVQEPADDEDDDEQGEDEHPDDDDSEDDEEGRTDDNADDGEDGYDDAGNHVEQDEEEDQT